MGPIRPLDYPRDGVKYNMGEGEKRDRSSNRSSGRVTYIAWSGTPRITVRLPTADPLVAHHFHGNSQRLPIILLQASRQGAIAVSAHYQAPNFPPFIPIDIDRASTTDIAIVRLSQLPYRV